MTSFKATPAGNKSPWLKTFSQNEQRDAFRQHSPPSDSLLDQQSWRRSLTRGTAHHGLHMVKNHKPSSLPRGRRRGSWTGPVLQPGAGPCLGLQLILLSPAGLAGLFAPTPELWVTQLLTPPAGEIPMQTEIIYWKVNHFPQSEFTKFKNCQLIQNYIFKLKPEGTILAEENSCQLCLNVAEIFFPSLYFFHPHPFKSSLTCTFMGSTSYFSCPPTHVYLSTQIWNRNFLFLPLYLGWYWKLSWENICTMKSPCGVPWKKLLAAWKWQ